MNKKYRVTLTPAERAELEGLLARGKADVRRLRHAQILLKTLSALARQCLSRRIARTDTLERHIQHWEERRTAAATTVHWQFTTADARIKLRSLYPSLQT